MTSRFSFGARPLAFVAGALAVTFSLAACDTAAPGAPGAPDPSPTPTSSADVVDPAAVGADGSTATLANGRTTATTNETLAAIAKATARALANDDVRAYVHSRALNRFDGETNVLWRALETAIDGPTGFGTRHGLVFSSFLSATSPELAAAGLGTAGQLNAFVLSASRELGGPMHLLWIGAERVGADQAPLVTFTPLGMDPDAIERILAYDADGREHVVDDAVAATRPVVAISFNERVTEADITALENGTFHPRNSAPGSARVEEMPCDDPYAMSCGGGGGGGGGGTGGGGSTPDGPNDHRAGTANDATSGQARLEYIRLYHDYEGFTMGDPELRMTITSFNAATDTTNASVVIDTWHSHPVDDAWADGEKIHFDKNLQPWNIDNNPTLSIKWTEVDGTPPSIANFLIEEAEFELPAWAQTAVRIIDYAIKKAGEDEDLGHADVNYDTSLPMHYGLGNPDFELSRNP